MNGISRNMVSAAPKPKTFCPGNHILLEYQTEGDEERWLAVGATRAGRILSIVFAVRRDAVRPITGWVADKETADAYARQWGPE